MSGTRTDFVNERSHIRDYTKWPINVIYGLNSFGVFQAINNFVTTGVDTAFSIFPWTGSFNRQSYVQNSLRLTRYRNYHDDVL